MVQVRFAAVSVAAVIAAASGYPGHAEATLFDRGNGMIYDSVLDVTWLSHTHYASVEFRNDPGRVAEIIDVVGTVDGHALTAADFDTAGGNIGVMTWWGATAWADQLVYGGYSDWRLPNSDGFTTGLARTPANELGYLNNVTRFSEPGFGSYFTAYAATRYWLAQENASDPTRAWFINFAYSGTQNPSLLKGSTGYAWALRDGDVSPVPEPASLWLLGPGLLLMFGISRRRKTAS